MTSDFRIFSDFSDLREQWNADDTDFADLCGFFDSYLNLTSCRNLLGITSLRTACSL
jgi:hypothetical protein